MVQRSAIALVVSAAFLAIVRGTFAAAYDDFARGISANLQGDNAQAVISFSAAIAAGDLNATLLPAAYRGRGLANLRLGQCKSAIADLNEFTRLKPGDVQGLELRAEAFACAGEFSAAESDLTQVIVARPERGAFWNRGRIRWRMKQFAGAADDFAHVVELEPENGFAVLWLELSRARGGALDPKVGEHDLHELDSNDWPAPLIKLFLGDAKPENISTAALHGDADKVINQQCEADFYIAEWWLARNDTASAKPLLESAYQKCPKNFIEYAEARFELGTLK
jgi:lipoprotein NlpI